MGGVLTGGAINPAGLDGQLFLAVDRSGTATNNNIYMLASVQPSGRTTTDVMFVRSTDGGLTFSAPHKVNDDPVNPSKWHWFGTFAVAPNGRLDAVWYDTRNAANNTDSQLFYSYSTDAGVTWSPNVSVSNAFNPFEGYPNQNKIGDYITIVSDNTGGNVAYCRHVQFQPAVAINMKKTCITFGYSLVDRGPRRRLHQLLVQRRQLPLLPHRLQPRRLLSRQPLQRHLQLLLLPAPRRRQDLSQRRGRVPRHTPGRDLVVAMTALWPCWHVAAPRQSEAAITEISQRVRCANFQVSVSSSLIGHKFSTTLTFWIREARQRSDSGL